MSNSPFDSSAVENGRFHAFLERLFAKDEQAAAQLDAFYRQRLIQRVQNAMNRLLRSREGPEDVVQSVWKSFFRQAHAQRYTFDHPGALWCLLQTIARHKVEKRAAYWPAKKRDFRREVPIDGEQLFERPTRAQARLLGDVLEAVLNHGHRIKSSICAVASKTTWCFLQT